jgi:uncharacterized protein
LKPLHASESDIAAVTEQLGRTPMGAFDVVVRDADGQPVVIRNEPRLHDGTPMPTLYWLTGPEQIRDIGHIEAAGGVDEAEAEVDPDALQQAHDAYARERDEMLGPDDGRPRPSGGVGGTRRGVKCLHAHYAYYLAGGNDPVGDWIGARLRKMKGHR